MKQAIKWIYHRTVGKPALSMAKAMGLRILAVKYPVKAHFGEEWQPAQNGATSVW